MKKQKLRLRMDDLQVQSFETARDAAERGTVRAHEPADTATAYDAVLQWGCACNTFDITCDGTCAASCANSCPGQWGCDDNETNYLTCGGTCRWVRGAAELC